MRDLLTRLGGRKFFVTVFFGIVNALLVMHGHVTAGIYRDLFLGSVAAFIIGNVTQKVKGRAQPIDE